MWIFPRRSRTEEAPKASTFLDEDDDPLGVWSDYQDPDPQIELLLNTIGQEEQRPSKPIPVQKNLDRIKKVNVRIGLPLTLRGALDRQRVRRQMRTKREFIPQKLRLDAHRVH